MICVNCMYAEFHYHKMTSVTTLLVIVLILAAIFPEVIETSSIMKKKCYRSKAKCQYHGGKLQFYKCRVLCKSQGKRASVCDRLKKGCYGCKCITNDTLKTPGTTKDALEKKPLLYIYRLLMKYMKKRRHPKYRRP